MANYVIPQRAVIVKCLNCKTLYVPDMTKNIFWFNKEFKSFEKCPICGYEGNSYRQTIPLWKYNLIKLFRGGFREQS